MSYQPPTHKRGDPIRAADRNAMNAQLRRLAGVRGGPGLVVRDGAAGLQVARLRPEEIYLRLTGAANSDGGYPWVEVYPAAGGTWTTSGRTGSSSDDPAYDRLGNAALTVDSMPYLARRAPTSAAWVFKGKTECSADSAHFCACGCLVPFPKTLFVGDDSGTHTLTGNAFIGVGGRWTTTSISMPNTITWCRSGEVDCDQYGSHTETFTYFYRLTFRCAAGGGDPAGWKLEVVFNIVGCTDAPGSIRFNWSQCVNGTSGFSVAGFLPLDCGYDGITFTLPTTPTGGIAPTPGGGGSLTVVA